MPRKTFDVSKFVEFSNELLADEELLQRDKELICAILEAVLTSTENKYSFVSIHGDQFTRKYSIVGD